MRVAGRVLLSLVGALAVLVGGLLLAREAGPTTYLRTHDAAGAFTETKVWFVEREGAIWIRAGQTDRGWYQDLLARPEVEVGEPGGWHAVLAYSENTDEARARFQQWLEEEYPTLGRLPRLLNLAAAAPVRLEPRAQ